MVLVPVLFSLEGPFIGAWRGIIGALLFVLLTAIFVFVVFTVDPLSPGVWSGNPTCPGPATGTEYNEIFRELAADYVVFGCAVSSGILLQFVRPQYMLIGAGSTTLIGFGFSLVSRSLFGVVWIVAGVVVPILFKFLQAYSKRAALNATKADVSKYEEKWIAAGGRGSQQCGSSQIEESASSSSGHGRIHPESDRNQHRSDTTAALNSIEKICGEALTTIKTQIKEAGSFRHFLKEAWQRNATPTSRVALWKRLLFRIRARALGPYSRTGKIRQKTSDIDILFEEAALVNDSFFAFLQSEMDSVFETGVMCPGPVKRPDRSLQKVVRTYYRDPRCLTDLVRCVILLDSIVGVAKVLEEFMEKSVVAGAESEPKPSFKDEESLLNRQKHFRITKMKDRFSTTKAIGYRDICLNVEVGWTIQSESDRELEFVTVDRFEKKGIRTHICEVRVHHNEHSKHARDKLHDMCHISRADITVYRNSFSMPQIQLMLESMYDLKVGGCHDNFVLARNLLAS